MMILYIAAAAEAFLWRSEALYIQVVTVCTCDTGRAGEPLAAAEILEIFRVMSSPGPPYALRRS